MVKLTENIKAGTGESKLGDGLVALFYGISTLFGSSNIEKVGGDKGERESVK